MANHTSNIIHEFSFVLATNISMACSYACGGGGHGVHLTARLHVELVDGTLE